MQENLVIMGRYEPLPVEQTGIDFIVKSNPLL